MENLIKFGQVDPLHSSHACHADDLKKEKKD